jgi:hypothetical protein
VVIDVNVRANEGRPSGIEPGVHQMLLYEALARARMREAEEAARHDRVVRRLVAGRRWAWLARYANERAERARRVV